MAKKNRKQNMQKRNKAEAKPRLAHAVEAFIEQNQTVVSALAWGGYQQEGRGFVLVTIDDEGGLDASYIGERDDLWPALAPDFPEISELVNTYDPKHEVVLINRVPDYTQMAVAVFDVPPPIAFVQHQDMFD